MKKAKEKSKFEQLLDRVKTAQKVAGKRGKGASTDDLYYDVITSSFNDGLDEVRLPDFLVTLRKRTNDITDTANYLDWYFKVGGTVSLLEYKGRLQEQADYLDNTVKCIENWLSERTTKKKVKK